MTAREQAAGALLKFDNLRAEGMSDQEFEREKKQVIRQVAKITDGISFRGIMEISKLAKAEDKLTSEGITEVTRQYRSGLSENPWQREGVRKQIKEGDSFLKDLVKGQDHAIRKVLNILMRSSVNLTSAFSTDRGTQPRGVLFLTGPTGTGKTELTKSITKLIFGTVDALIRFDMSEFGEEHTRSRLIGAPPGYMGYNQAGELTKAVKERPFSVILFDEIEKMHPDIWQIFLQILDDGRLTDSKGETVFFDESIIIFTSNQGMQAVTPMHDVESEEEFKCFSKDVNDEIKKYFDEKPVGRPELYGRIGEDNFIVFKPFNTATATAIAENKIENVVANVRRQHQKSITFSEEGKKKLLEKAIEGAISTQSRGGRDIIDKLRKYLINPFSQVLFNHIDRSEFHIEGFEEEDGEVRLIIQGLDETVVEGTVESE
jgi:ATP-dependent Clp protease ATP-binding subunit ClpA